MRVYSETQRFDQWWLKLLMFAVAVITIGGAILGYTKITPEEQEVFLSTMVPIVLITIITTGAIFFVKLKTKIDEKGIQYGFWPFQRNLKLAGWTEIEEVYIRKYRPLTEFGGWGYKYSLKGNGKVYNTKGNLGIQIVFKDGKKTLVGTQDSKKVQQVIDFYTSKEKNYEN
jgi:hypothetical protein